MDDIEQIDSEISPKRTLTDEFEHPTEPKEPQTDEIEPKRTHYTQTEIEMTQGLIDEGYSTREIATKMNRTVSGIRNLRRRLDLTSKIEERLPTLREQEKDLETNLQELTILSEIRSKAVKDLQHQKVELTEQVTALEEEQANLKHLVDYYRNHREEVLHELRTLMQNEADLIGIQKILQWLEGIK